MAAQQRVADEEKTQRVAGETRVNETHEAPKEVEAEARRRNPYVQRKRRRKKKGGHDDGRSQRFYNATEHEEVAEDPAYHDFDVSV